VYQWDLEKGYVAEEAIREADCIIHLAGAGVADERWTTRRKKEILDSRTNRAGCCTKGCNACPTG
jgi:NAD dependent epimerase/dehydratase family enzyme